MGALSAVLETGRNVRERRIDKFTLKLCMLHTGGGGLYKLEIMHFKSCTKILYAICSVFFRICAGNNSKHPLFLMSNYWEPYIICSLIFKKWYGLCCARFCRFIFSPARNIPPPPPRWFLVVHQEDKLQRLP